MASDHKDLKTGMIYTYVVNLEPAGVRIPDLEVIAKFFMPVLMKHH